MTQARALDSDARVVSFKKLFWLRHWGGDFEFGCFWSCVSQDRKCVVMQDWLVDTGADVHAAGKSSWRGKRSYPLKPTSVKLRGVSGADFQAFGTCLVKGTSGKQPIELEGIRRRCALSGSRLRRVYFFDLRVAQLAWCTLQATEANNKHPQTRSAELRAEIRVAHWHWIDSRDCHSVGRRRETCPRT